MGNDDGMRSGVVDYTQGFGSFDFLPRAFPETVPRYVSAQQRRPRGRAAVTPDASASTPFLFMRLPLKIRTKIYQLLLSALYPGRHLGLHKNAVNAGVWFKVNDSPCVPGWLEVDYEMHVTRRPEHYNHLPQRGPSPDAGSGEEKSRSANDDTESDGDDDDDVPSSPGSTNPLRVVDVTIERAMDPDPGCRPSWHDEYDEDGDNHDDDDMEYGDIDDCTCYYRTPDDYHECLGLSQVSRQFTAELGACLWQNATVEFVDPTVFFLFAQNRPAALLHTRGIVLHVQYHGDAFDTPPPEMLREICAFVSANLTVRCFTVVLSTVLTLQEDGRSPFGAFSRDAAEAGLGEAAGAFRELEIDGAFNVTFDRGYPWGSLITPHERENLLRAVREAWLPRCIREREQAEEEADAIRREETRGVVVN